MLQTLFHIMGIVNICIAGACVYTGIKLKDWPSMLFGFILLGGLMIDMGVLCLMV
jgi:hypothetical protein